MKKRMLILLAAVLLMLLTACGSAPAKETAAAGNPAATAREETEKKEKTLRSLAEAAAKDTAELASFSADELLDMTGIKPEDYTDYIFLQGDVLTGREILAVRAKDETAAVRIAEQMERYLLRRREENRNYAPKAYQTLCEALVEQKGLVLVLISGDNAETETAAILAGE